MFTVHDLHCFVLGKPLELVGFSIGKAYKSRKIEQLTFDNIQALKKDVRKGRLYIMPAQKLDYSVSQLHVQISYIISTSIIQNKYVL